jgi:hypothetical protein
MQAPDSGWSGGWQKHLDAIYGHQWSEGKIWKGKFEYVYRTNLKTLLNITWTVYYAAELRGSELKCLAHYHLSANLSKA